MNYTLFILEDNYVHYIYLSKLIEEYGTKHNIHFHILNANTLQKACALLPLYQIDIFLLDISLKKDDSNQDGITFAHTIQSQFANKNKPILFITAYKMYMSYAINQLHCFSFLTKPYYKEELFSQFDDLFAQMNKSLMIKCLDGTYFPLFPSQLIYVYSRGRYLTYVTTHHSFQSRQYTMQGLFKLLGSPFVRCHKSYIVNQTYIENYDFLSHYAHLTNSKALIPLSRNFHI